jgi:hypothetical protein
LNRENDLDAKRWKVEKFGWERLEEDILEVSLKLQWKPKLPDKLWRLEVFHDGKVLKGVEVVLD